MGIQRSFYCWVQFVRSQASVSLCFYCQQILVGLSACLLFVVSIVEVYHLINKTPSWYIESSDFEEDADYLSDDTVELEGIGQWNATWWLPWVDWSVAIVGILMSLLGLWMVLGRLCKSTTEASSNMPNYFLLGLFVLGPAWIVFHFYASTHREKALNDVHLAVLWDENAEYASEDPSWKDDTTIFFETQAAMIPVAFLWCLGCCVARWYQIASGDIDDYYETDVQEWEASQEEIEMQLILTAPRGEEDEDAASWSPSVERY